MGLATILREHLESPTLTLTLTLTLTPTPFLVRESEPVEKKRSRPALFFTASALFIATSGWYLVVGGLIEIGGDAFSRWEDVKTWAFSGITPNLDHHSLRWGLNLPLFLFFKVSQSSYPAIYHVLPAVFGAGTAVFLYMIFRGGNFELTREIGCCGIALSILALPFFDRAFGQMLATGPAIFYIAGALLFLKNGFNQKSSRRSINFFLAGAFLLFAYGCRVSSIWLVLPVASYVIVDCTRQKSFRNFWFFVTPIATGILIETAVIAYYTSFWGGRAFFIIREGSSHASWLQNPQDQSGVGVSQALDYLLSPRKYFDALGWYSLAVYGGVVLAARNLLLKKASNYQGCLGAAVIGVFFLQSYTVVGVFPFIYPEPAYYARLQLPMLFLSLTYIGYQILSRTALTKPPFIFTSSAIVGVGALVTTVTFFSNPIISRADNFGFLVSVIHNKILTEWIDHGGNFGYRAEMIESAEQVNVAESLERSANQQIVSAYVRSIYQRDYCEVTETFVYRDEDSVFALCREWKEGESVLFYYATSLEFLRPKNLIYLGKYSDIDN